MSKCYVSVDVEGSISRSNGIIVLPPESNMVSLGACVVGSPEQQFYAELVPINDNWSATAEGIHRLSQEHLFNNGKSPRRVMMDFYWWVLDMAYTAEPVFCSMPLCYDWGYVRWYFDHCIVRNPFVETLDARDLYRRIKKLKVYESASHDRIRADFPSTLEHTHNALHDALEQEEMFRGMLKVRE